MRGGAHLAKKKFVSSEMRETSHRVKKRHAFRWKRKKETFEENGKRDLLRETRNEKRDISYEKWDISRNVWHFTRNLVVDIEKVRQSQ